jgi:hypothetical protein
LAPLITNHNVDAGVGVDLGDKWGLNLTYGLVVKNSMTESGTGGTVSAAGTGTNVDYMAHFFMLGFSYKWNTKETDKLESTL